MKPVRNFKVAALLCAFALLAAPALAQTAAAPTPAVTPTPTPSFTPPTSTVVAPIIMVPLDQLMAPGVLPDIAQGAATAPITIVEYASMTCSHCAAFRETTWPELKSKYIDSGKARFILREFPLDPLATAGFMLARCVGPEKRNILIDQLFAQQKSWAFVDKPIEPLLAIVKQIGFSQTDFETCLRNQDLYEQVSQMRERAAADFNIDSTPTFFINGRKLTGELTMVDFDRVMDPLVK